MTVKRKKKGGFSGGRTVTVAFSLCLLAVVTMIGMYTVGRTDQQQKELEQQVAEAEEEARAREQAQAEAEKVAKEAEKSEDRSGGNRRNRNFGRNGGSVLGRRGFRADGSFLFSGNGSAALACSRKCHYGLQYGQDRLFCHFGSVQI